MKRPQIPQKHVYEKFHVHEKKLRTQSCCHKFIKNLLPEKRKKKTHVNQTTAPQITIEKLALNKYLTAIWCVINTELRFMQIDSARIWWTVCIVDDTRLVFFNVFFKLEEQKFLANQIQSNTGNMVLIFVL